MVYFCHNWEGCGKFMQAMLNALKMRGIGIALPLINAFEPPCGLIVLPIFIKTLEISNFM